MFSGLLSYIKSPWRLISLILLFGTITLGAILLFRKTHPPDDTSLDDIRKRGVLVVIMRYNSVDYFLYKGHPMGFQLELVRELAKHLDVQLKIIPSNHVEKSFRSLEKNEADFMASMLSVSHSRKGRILFTDPIIRTRQVLVQRQRDSIDAGYIQKHDDLIDQVVCVPAKSIYESQLESLQEQIGGGITIVGLPETDEEELIAMVSRGEIQYTVASEINAKIFKKFYFGNLDVDLPISFDQASAWALPNSSTQLCEYINRWWADFQKSKTFENIYFRYYVSPRRGYRNDDNYCTSTGKISPFDPLIKKHAKTIHWDWRLLASLIYQESQFNPSVVSHKGALGIMQLMPEVAGKYGVTIESSVNEQIAAGVKHIQSIQKALPPQISKKEEIPFILAAYNAGLGHILDARRLAESSGKNPNVWHKNVDEELLKKSNKQALKDTLIRHGYAKGDQTFEFVSDILKRYQHYKNFVK